MTLRLTIILVPTDLGEAISVRVYSKSTISADESIWITETNQVYLTPELFDQFEDLHGDTRKQAAFLSKIKKVSLPSLPDGNVS